MKTNSNTKLKISVVISFILAVIIFAITIILYRRSYFDSLNVIMTFSIGIMSLIISIVALLVSLSTYFSIDSVNVISSMEGNVLCNENYNAEYLILVQKYENCKNRDELESALYEHLYDRLKNHSKTCMQFTDTIQEILDNILWYAYVDTRTDSYREHVQTLIELLNEKYDSFSAISNGNQYVLREHIKLIMNVLNYQSVAHEGSIISPNGEMLNIRGRMFINTVSKTIYYDYLGLEYHKKALDLLKEITGFSGEEYLIQNMNLIRDAAYTPEQREELSIYLTYAKDSFDKAYESCKEDLLWYGYISFNKARIELLSMIINNDFGDNWDQSILNSISARYGVMKLFSADKGNSFLHVEFQKEYYYSKVLHLLMKKYLCEDEESIRKEASDLKNSIPSADAENGVIFKRTTQYLDDILS